MSAQDELETRPLTGFSFDEIAEAMNRAYLGYVVPVEVDGAMTARRMVVEQIDAGVSSVLVDTHGAAQGLVLIARRDDISRVAAIGFAPEFRGLGHGGRQMRRVLDEARARGDRQMRLEVISTNAAAVRTYEKCGFEIVRDLVGFALEADGEGVPAEDYVTGMPGAALPVLAAALPSDMEWQIALPSLAAGTLPTQSFVRRDGRAAAIFVVTPQGNRLMSVGVVPDEQRQGLGRELLRALTGAFPGKWQVPAVAPAELEPFFAACGWALTDLRQHEMLCELSGAKD